MTLTVTSRGGGSASGDAQLSPNISIMQQQLSPSQPQRGNTTPYSPQANQSKFKHTCGDVLYSNFITLDFQQNPFNANNGGQRQLSPQQQQQLLNNFQQQAANNSNGANNNASQLSPRQPPFTQAQSNTTNWNQQNAARLSLQQTNPMLNAQLSVSFWKV